MTSDLNLHWWPSPSKTTICKCAAEVLVEARFCYPLVTFSGIGTNKQSSVKRPVQVDMLVRLRVVVWTGLQWGLGSTKWMEVKQCPVKVRCNNLCMCVFLPAALTLFKPLGMFGLVSFWALYADKGYGQGLWEDIDSWIIGFIHINKSKLSMSDYSSLMARRLRGYRKNAAFLYCAPVPLANESLYHFIWNLTISVKPPLRWPHIHAHTNFTHPNLHSRLQSTFPPT